MLLNNNSLIMQWNRDENGNPVSMHIPREVQQVSPTHGVIQLVQVPDQHQRVKIVTEDNIQLNEVFNIEDITEDGFFVDYGVGIVRFHESLHGKMLLISYYGRGVILISDSRIFHRDGENVADTWDNILARSQDALDLIESAGGLVEAMGKIDQKVEEGNMVIGRLEDFITETQFYGYTIALSREAFVVKAKEDGDVSKNEIQSIFTDVLVYQGAKQIIPTLSIEQENGCVFTIEGQRVKLASIDINFIKANAVLNIDCGDGLVAKRTLEVTKVFDGVSQYSVEMTNAFYSFEANSAGDIEDEKSVTCDITVTKANIDYTNYSITVQGAPQGLRYTVGTDSVTFTGARGSALPSHGSCLVVVTIDGVAYNKSFTWNKTRKGQDAKSLTLIGSQILRYETNDYSDVPNPSRSTITAKTVGLSGTPKWYVQNGSEWTLLEGQMGTELAFLHNDATIWGSRKETTIKCELEGYEDEITLVKLATGTNGVDAVTVVLTNESHTVAIDNSGQVHELEITNARTNVLAFKGTQEVTPVLSKGECVGCDIAFSQNTVQLISLDNSFSTATANINVTVDGVTVVKTWTISKAKQGSDGATGADGNSYILNITDGTRSFTYSQVNQDPRPATSTTFVGRLYENGNEIVEGVSYYWVANGHLEGSSIQNTFTPTIKPIFDESILNNDIQLTVSYKGNTIVQTVPVSITKDANGLDWVQEWDDTKTDIRGNLILTPKLFAGSYDQANDLVTGVAMGKDILNDGATVGVAGYQNNKVTFLLDTDGTLMVGNPFEEGSTGMYFDGNNFTLKVNQLSIEGVEVPTANDMNSKVEQAVSQAKEEVRAEISDVVAQVGNLDSYMNNALKDGILDSVERGKLESLYDNLATEVTDVSAQFNSIMGNPFLTNELLIETLTLNMTDYSNKFIALTEIFNKILESVVIEGTDVEIYKNATADFKDASAVLHQSMNDALTSISETQANTIVAQAKEEIKKEIDGVSGSLTDLENTMNGDFKSGLINNINLTNLRSRLSQLETEKSDVDGQYKALVENSKLGATTRTQLANAKSELDTAHAQLVAKITSAISDMLMTEQELAEINSLISIYVTKLGLYSEIAQKANADIALNSAQGAVDALNQEAIFNKLTNNGEKQGIYLQDGKIYVNGEYINTRNFKAVRDDLTETFKIDADGNVHIRANSFHLTGDDTNMANKDYVDSAIKNVSIGNVNVMLSNEAQVIATSNTRVPLSNQSFSTTVKLYMGTSEVTDFTIGTVASANGITVSVSPLTKVVTFTVKTNTALTVDSGTFTIPVISNGKTYNKEWSWAVSKQGNSGSNGTNGSNGADAKHIIVNGEQVFKYSNNFTGTPTPSSITLTATKVNTTDTGKWQYKNTSGVWTDWQVGSVVQTGTTLSVSPTSYDLSTQKAMSIRYIIGAIYDEITLVKVSDGADGKDGIQGAKGQDGVSTYFYVRYSANADGSSMTSSPTSSSKYMGVCSTTSSTAPTSNTSYSWSLIKGADGEKGVAGAKGADGKSSYLHVKYSDDGTTFTANNGETVGKYIGTYVDYTEADSNVFSAYTWKKFVGEDGSDGKGVASITEYYLATSSSSGVTTSTSGWKTGIQSMTTTNKYLWNYEVIKYTDNSATTTTPVIIGVHGSTGATGNGISAITNYYLATSSGSGVTTSTSGWTTAIQTMTTTNKYLWNYEVIQYTSGTPYTGTPRIIGVYGATGAKGDKGDTGASGADAITIVLSNETHSFPCENNGNIPTALTTTCVVTAYKGATSVTPTIGTITNPSGMTITKSGTTLTIQANTGTSLADTGSVNIPITVDGKSFTKVFSWSKAKKGATGSTGANGSNGADAKTVDILASSQVFKSTDGGKTFSPDTITLTPSLQNVTYSNWQYSVNGGRSWTTVTSGVNGLTISGNALTISKSSALYTASVTSIVFRVNTSVSTVYDTVTVVKLYDVVELTQLDIFNKLTNNGATQGIYLENSKLYLNGEYMKAKSLTADKLHADVLSANNIVSIINGGSTTISGSKITTGSIEADKLSIGIAENGGYSRNANFSKWTSTYPNGTSEWGGGGISKVSVDGKNVAQFTCSTASTQYGMVLQTSFFANGIDLTGVQYICIEAKVRLTSGTSFNGSAILLDVFRTDSTYERISLYLNQLGTATTNTWYTVRKICKLSDAAVAKTFSYVSGYALANWSGGGTMTAKTIQFASVNFYHATEQDYLTQTWTSGTEINGANIKTGTLVADKITSGTFQGTNFIAGGSGNNGSVLVKDSSNNITFLGDKNGIKAKEITFFEHPTATSSNISTTLKSDGVDISYWDDETEIGTTFSNETSYNFDGLEMHRSSQHTDYRITSESEINVFGSRFSRTGEYREESISGAVMFGLADSSAKGLGSYYVPSIVYNNKADGSSDYGHGFYIAKNLDRDLKSFNSNSWTGTEGVMLHIDNEGTTNVRSLVSKAGVSATTFTQSNYAVPIEIGKYIDMHQSGSANDVDVRLIARDRQGLQIARGDNLSKYIEVGVGGDDRYFYNNTSGRYLALKDDGRLTYDTFTVPHNWRQNFTPFIFSDTGNFTMVERWGEAVYLGDLVWIRGRVRGSRGGHTGTVYIGGLPVSCIAGYPALELAFFGGVYTTLGSNAFEIKCYIEASASHAILNYTDKSTGGWHALQCSHLITGNIDIAFSATYRWR